MADMLVKLYDIPDKRDVFDALQGEGIVLKRAMAVDKMPILDFVAKEFSSISAAWVDECGKALYREPGSCFIAVRKKKVIGFSCYDATARGFIGPIGVMKKFRRKGIAGALLVKCMEAMEAEGYGYAVIGWVSSVDYYRKSVGAFEIPDSSPGVYARMIEM